MTLDEFGLVPLIENMSFVPSLGEEAGELGAGPTLDLASVRLVEAAHMAPATEILSERAEIWNEAMAMDLWIHTKIGPGSGSSTAVLAFEPLNEPLSIKEIGQVANYGEQGQHVIVTGHRYSYNPGTGGYDMGGDNHWQYSSEQPVPPPEPPAPSPEDLNCKDTSQMTPQELLDYRISEEAAKVAREILAMPDHDIREYASYIYMDANGQMAHTPINPGGLTDSVPSDAGIRYGQIYGVIHSHTALTFVAGNPDYKLFPTPDTSSPGDWAGYDASSAAIYTSLINEFGRSSFEVTTQLAQFRQYILGPSGPVGSGLYKLHGYDANDRDIITLGQKISLTLGLCS